MTEDELIREIRAKREEASSAPLEVLEALRVFARAIVAAFDGGLIAEVVHVEARRPVVAGIGDDQADMWQVQIRGQGGAALFFDPVWVGPRGARIDVWEGKGEVWEGEGEWIAEPDRLLVALAGRMTPVGLRRLERMVRVG